MAASLFFRETIILGKIEATYGADPTPGAADGVLMTDVEFRPMEGEDVSRDLLRPWMGAEPEIPVGLHCVLTGSTELAGSGAAGTAPKWGFLARACGLAQTLSAGVSVTYSPAATPHESAALYLWMGGTQYKMTGVRGTGVLTLDAQNLPRIKWTLTGLFNAPAEAARVLPTLTGWTVPKPATRANTPVFTANAVALALRNYSFDLGCKVEKRFLVNKDEILIVDRSEMLKAQVEAISLATFNPFALSQAQTLFAVALTHGTVAGNIATLTVPAAQIKRLANYQIVQDVVEWPLEFLPIPTAGYDQFSLVLT